MAGPTCSFASCLQKALFPLVALTFTTWVISLGGVGSMQYFCEEPYKNAGYLAGVRGFSAYTVDCYRLYSYYWFVVALEFIILCGLALSVMSGYLAATRLAWTGLLAVATCLYMQSADSFLGAASVQHYESGLEGETARATAAGFVMTACFNFILILAVGSETKSQTESSCCRSGKQDPNGEQPTQ